MNKPVNKPAKGDEDTGNVVRAVASRSPRTQTPPRSSSSRGGAPEVQAGGRVKKHARTLGELLLLGALAGLLLVVVVAMAQHVFDDEKTEYFVIGYYAAVHKDLALWIWKRLGVEKKNDEKE